MRHPERDLSQLERRVRRAAYDDLVQRTHTRPMPVILLETLLDLTRDPLPEH